MARDGGTWTIEIALPRGTPSSPLDPHLLPDPIVRCLGCKLPAHWSPGEYAGDLGHGRV